MRGLSHVSTPVSYVMRIAIRSTQIRTWVDISGAPTVEQKADPHHVTVRTILPTHAILYGDGGGDLSAVVYGLVLTKAGHVNNSFGTVEITDHETRRQVRELFRAANA